MHSNSSCIHEGDSFSHITGSFLPFGAAFGDRELDTELYDDRGKYVRMRRASSWPVFGQHRYSFYVSPSKILVCTLENILQDTDFSLEGVHIIIDYKNYEYSR